MPHILDPRHIKESVKRLHATHCTSEPSTDGEAGMISHSRPQEVNAG